MRIDGGSVGASRPVPTTQEAAVRAPAVVCRGVTKRFYRYHHRTRSLREFFIRTVLRRPIHVRHAEFLLEGFDLSIAQGEAVALIGRNGSGKSTALRLIAGIYPPTEGIVEVRGRLAAVIELGVGFHPELTGVDNVFLYASVMGFRRREIVSRLPDVIAFAEIGDLIHEPVKIYSTGTKARLAFAVATVCVRPDILLIDEVLAVGDQSFRERCRQVLADFGASGGTLVLVGHDLRSMQTLCSRAIWLEGGRIRMDGDADTVFEAYRRSF